MSLILNIHTSTENAIICLAENGTVLSSANNAQQKDHAAFLQPAIKQLLEDCDLTLKQIDAVAITAGPGSYTGLRVGMASAKGLCYALKIPLMALSTLEVMALSIINTLQTGENEFFFCPMIDARRMEIFTAVYDDMLNEILSPCAMIIKDDMLNGLLEKNKIVYFGSGANKTRSVLENKNALFVDGEISPDGMASLSYKKFKQSQFASLSYASPLYIKEFYTILNK